MYIVDHKFTKPNGDIRESQSEIISLIQNKQPKLMRQGGFLGINLDTSSDNTCFTVSVYWESNDARKASNAATNSIEPNEALQSYLLEHEIVYTKTRKEVV